MVILCLPATLIALFFACVAFLWICSLFIDPKKEYPDNSRFYRALLNGSTGMALRLLRIRVRVTGADALPQDTRFLLVSNHLSSYDPLITWYIFRRHPIGFISKPSNFRIPIFGRIIRKCCFMPIDREDPMKALPTIRRAADVLRRQEACVGVYPEGTRSKSGELLPFHNAMFKIAQLANAPIAVMRIEGTEHIARNLKRLRASQVSVEVVQVIPAQTVRAARADELGEHIRSLMLHGAQTQQEAIA